jgi:hypothetical protein
VSLAREELNEGGKVVKPRLERILAFKSVAILDLGTGDIEVGSYVPWTWVTFAAFEEVMIVSATSALTSKNGSRKERAENWLSGGYWCSSLSLGAMLSGRAKHRILQKRCKS